jgi:CheY-like chemotaxis protein
LEGLRILVVDDQPDARQLLTKVFERAGAAVQAAGSTDEALKLIKKGRLDVLVSDIGMPESNGLDLIQHIRSNGFSAKELPAIALTAYAQESDVQQVLLAGFQLHVPKPIDPNVLTRLISNLVASAEPD